MGSSQADSAAFLACLEISPDITLDINGYKWDVHRRVISKYSDFFRIECNKLSKNAGKRTITLQKDCPWMVGRMIRWFYTGSLWDDVWPNQPYHRSDDLVDIMARNKKGKEYTAFEQADREREPWKRKLLFCELAMKYRIPLLLTPMQLGLKRDIDDNPPLGISILVEICTTSLIIANQTFCEEILQDIFGHEDDVCKLYDKIEEICGAHKGFMKMVRKARSNRLEFLKSESAKEVQSLISTVSKLQNDLKDEQVQTLFRADKQAKRKLEDMEQTLDKVLPKKKKTRKHHLGAGKTH